MDKIARVRQEIERHRQAIRVLNEHTTPEQMSKTCAIFQYSDSILSELNSFLDTLSEEPDKSLEEAAKEHTLKVVCESGNNWIINIKDAFIAGAEWQASQMPMPEDTVLFNKGVAEGRRLEREDMLKDAVEGYVNYYEDSGGILMAEAQVGCPYHNGDKVRIIIIKEDEK